MIHRLLENAEGDDDLLAIKKFLEDRGYATDAVPQLQGL